MTIITPNHPNQHQEQQFLSHSNSIFINNPGLSSTYNQPYRYGGRVGLFGHYLRSLKIILLLTSLKLDNAMVHSELKFQKKAHFQKYKIQFFDIFKSTKTHFLLFQKWQKIHFCTKKKGLKL